MAKTEKPEYEKALVTCNRCKHLNFALKQCRKNKKKPIALNTFTNGDGFVYCVRPTSCEVNNG